MSTEKNVYEASRWLKTGEDDLEAATIMKKNNKFSHACFHAQQAGEKAIKAIWNYADADPWGHSIRKLIWDLQGVDMNLYERFKNLSRTATILDRFYIPTRYPNGLPELTPAEAYLEEDATLCIQQAAEILAAVKAFLPGNSKKMN